MWRLSSHGADCSKTQRKSLSDCEDKEDDDMEKVDNGVVEDATDGFFVPDRNLSDIQVSFVPSHQCSWTLRQCPEFPENHHIFATFTGVS